MRPTARVKMPDGTVQNLTVKEYSEMDRLNMGGFCVGMAREVTDVEGMLPGYRLMGVLSAECEYVMVRDGHTGVTA